MKRGLLIVLIVSLAVNLFVLGGAAGVALMGFPLHRNANGGPPRLAAAGATLAPHQREAWQAAMRQASQTSGAKIVQARRLRREAWRGLNEDKVDAQAVLAALDRSRTLEMQARWEMDRAVVGFAATLPADDRRKLAEALSARRGPPPGNCSGGGARAMHPQPALPNR